MMCIAVTFVKIVARKPRFSFESLRNVIWRCSVEQYDIWTVKMAVADYLWVTQ